MIASRRSREGAWIEIWRTALKERRVEVAPARERGLKSLISIYCGRPTSVAPAREREFKFAYGGLPPYPTFVAPARERGLKF